jgi:hypothetical protein
MARSLKTAVGASMLFLTMALPLQAFGEDAPAAQDVPGFVQRGIPGPGQEALKPLEGTWQVELSTYIAFGTRDKPMVSKDIICRRQWITGGRHLEDITKGTVGGETYERHGLLGYSNIDRRYEWVTADAVNANMMIYLGEPGSGEQMPISMSGRFTDQGLLGEEFAGKSIGQRTVITIESNDRHIVELYFTPEGSAEFLAQRGIYTRVKE